MKRRTIRGRFYREMVLMSLVLIIGGSIGLIKVYFWGIEDSARLSYIDLAESVIHQEIPQEYLSEWADMGNPRVWMGLDQVPKSILTMFPSQFHDENAILVQYEYKDHPLASQPHNGLMFNVFSGAPDRIHFFLKYLTPDNKDVYIYHSNVTAGLREQTRQRAVVLIIIGIAIAIFFLVVLFARRLSGIALRPMTQLSDMASLLDEKQTDQYFPVTEYNNEIGDVARTLQQTMKRIQEYHERETQFLRQASHELRTPIAVITSALDILEQRRRLGKTDLERPIADIRRSSREMSETVNAILELARSDAILEEKSTVDFGELLHSVIDDHRYLLTGKDVKIHIEIAPESPLLLEQTCIRIVLNNIIRNAFQHADKGGIDIRYRDGVLTLNNSFQPTQENAENNSQPSSGFGLGMTIVKAIAEKLDWTITTRVLGSDMQVTVKI